MASWIKDDYKGRGFLLLKTNDGVMELEQVPCSRSCERQEILIYGERLWQLYSEKYQWIKIYDRNMKLLEVIK